MIVQVKTFRITCDSCKAEVVYVSENRSSRQPEGWSYATSYCGDSYCSGHSNDICPKCKGKK